MDNINEVSKWLINNGTGMTYPSKNGNLKLQKLLYYSNALSLSVYDEPLFSNNVEAWVEGPVIKDAYVAYRYEELWAERAHNISVKAKDILNIVLDLFDDFNALELKKMTHNEEPWEQYKDEVAPYKQIFISNSDIKKYYKEAFKTVYENIKNEESIEVGNNIFLYNPQNTKLTQEDINILQEDFKDHFNEEFFVFKEDGDLIAY